MVAAQAALLQHATRIEHPIPVQSPFRIAKQARKIGHKFTIGIEHRPGHEAFTTQLATPDHPHIRAGAKRVLQRQVVVAGARTDIDEQTRRRRDAIDEFVSAALTRV